MKLVFFASPKRLNIPQVTDFVLLFLLLPGLIRSVSSQLCKSVYLFEGLFETYRHSEDSPYGGEMKRWCGGVSINAQGWPLTS